MSGILIGKRTRNKKAGQSGVDVTRLKEKFMSLKVTK